MLSICDFEYKAVTIADLHLTLSRIFSSWSTQSTLLVSPYNFLKVFVWIQRLSVLALYHLPHLVHDVVWALHFFFIGVYICIFPEHAAQFPLCFGSSGLGFIEIALHLLN